jgi:RND family efflux transporter MFP subunit
MRRERRGTRSRLVALLVALAPAAAGGAVVAAQAACARPAAQDTKHHCPMHPTYVSDHPGDCPICGMSLVPIPKDEAAAAPAAHGGHAGHAVPAPAQGAGEPAPAPAGWVCPMAECEVHQDEPGRCPKCGMNLVPAPAGAPAPQSDATAPGGVDGLAPVPTTADGRRLAGIRTAVATRDRLERTIRAVGTVAADETRVHRVHTRIPGWVERLYVDFEGRDVARGEPLLAIYSQELLASQEEYLRAREASRRLRASSLPEVREGGEELVAAARRRLELLDVPRALVKRLDRTGKPERLVVVPAPASGVVTAKQVFAGQQVEPGATLMTITDLSRVWVRADLAEREAGAVRPGDPAEMVLAQDPTVRLTGRVRQVDPYLDPATRTQKVRFDFDNPDGVLKPAMQVDVQLALSAAEGVVVPDSAVMDTGLRQVVFVAGDDGVFAPRRVRVALRTEGRALIAEGLGEGERVARTATFLLDSESRLRDALASAREVPAKPDETAAAAPAGHGAHR